MSLSFTVVVVRPSLAVLAAADWNDYRRAHSHSLLSKEVRSAKACEQETNKQTALHNQKALVSHGSQPAFLEPKLLAPKI